MGKAHGWRDLQNRRLDAGTGVILSPLFWECLHPEALPYMLLCLHLFFNTLNLCMLYKIVAG
jgi:hypothetical protein